MHYYTDLDQFPLSVQIIDDADSPNATNYNTSPEGVLNRTRWLYNAFNRVATRGPANSLYDSGVRLLRHTASIAGLRAVTDYNDGEIYLVDDWRLYQYNATSTATDDGDRSLSPVSFAFTGTGRWNAHDLNSFKTLAEVWDVSGTYTWVVPPGVYWIQVEGMGGGGGGAAGTGGMTPNVGGGGGGGAKSHVVMLETTPGTTVTIGVGAGGAGGVQNPGAGTVAGANGNLSYVATASLSSANSNAYFFGAQGAPGAATGDSVGGVSVSSPSPVLGSGQGPWYPGQGGGGAGGTAGTTGAYSSLMTGLSAPGAGGFALISGPNYGGGGGGGAAESNMIFQSGIGANGGGDGGGGASVTGLAGGLGGNGCGGGGGGAGGTSGGNGGKGGDGAIRITWVL